MGKKCIVCDAPAEYKIKDISDYYCKNCAEEHFADLTMLIKVEEEAQRLKQLVKEKMEQELKTGKELQHEQNDSNRQN